MQRIDSNYSYYLWKDSIMASVGWERVHEHCHTITAAKGWCHDMTAQAAIVMAPLMPCVGVGNMGGFKGAEQNKTRLVALLVLPPPPQWWGFIKILNKKRPNKRQAEKIYKKMSCMIDWQTFNPIDRLGRSKWIAKSKWGLYNEI